MSGKDTYIHEKKSRIAKCLAELTKLDAEAKEIGEEERILFEIQLKEFSDELKKLERSLSEMEMCKEDDLSGLQRETEKKWKSLKESFDRSVAKFDRIIKRE